MATEMSFAANKLRHDNHTPPTTVALRTFTVPANVMIFRNLDASITEYISFDGTNFFTILAGQSLSIEGSKQINYYSKAASGTPSMEVLYGSEK